MDPSLNWLNQQCEKNEDLLKKLEQKASRLPNSDNSWFYLNIDTLMVQNTTADETVSDYSNQTFVTIIPRSIDGNKSVSIVEEVQISQPITSSQLPTDLLTEIIEDQNLPGNIRGYISRQNASPGSEEVLNETDTLSFCQYIINSEKTFSEMTGIMLFKLVLYPKISSSDTTFLSQLFLQKLEGLTNKFPSFTINGVIIPLIKNEHLDKHQKDVICTILNVMKLEHIEATEKELLKAIPTDSEISIKLLKIIFDRKPRFGTEIASLLVQKLVDLSLTFSTNIQFGNLLIEIIPTLNEKLCEISLQNLKVIVEQHKTFMKMPALNLLSKLKIK